MAARERCGLPGFERPISLAVEVFALASMFINASRGLMAGKWLSVGSDGALGMDYPISQGELIQPGSSPSNWIAAFHT